MIAFTTLCYALGKQLGPEPASDLIERLFRAGDWDAYPWMRTLSAIQSHSPNPHVYYETACSHLGTARSRTFHWARTVEGSTPRTWISCDDDVAIDQVAAKALLEALAADVPRVVVVPTLSRDPSQRQLLQGTGNKSEGEPLRPIEAAGFGCVGVNQPAIHAIVAANQHLFYEGEFGPGMLALFWDVLTPDGQWYSEDLSFFLRVPASVQKWALTCGTSNHAGVVWKGED